MGENIVPAEKESPRGSLLAVLEKQEGAIIASLPKHLPAERMLRIGRTAISKTPALWECSPQSVIASIVEASQLGLEPNGPLGEAALVPFKNWRTKGKECQLMVQYRGYIELAERSGKVEFVDAQVVYEGDQFEFEYGSEQKLRHVPAFSRPASAGVVCVYGIVKFKTGASKFVVLSPAEVEEIRSCSRAADGDAWKKWWGEMAKKTALRRLFKYVPLSSEMKRATLIDDSTDAGVRPGQSQTKTVGQFSDAMLDTDDLAARLEAVAGDGEAEAGPEIETDDDGVVIETTAEIVEDAGTEPNEPAGPVEDPPHEYEPTDPDIFGGESKFAEKFKALRAEFVDLAESSGLSLDEALVKWNAKVVKLLGSEGFSTIGELDQKGKNYIVRSLAAAITDYRAALDAKDNG
jgi:recombination protein RecT